ncbi:DUF1906 domain-containing protein [Streptomyces sp. NPDC059373]
MKKSRIRLLVRVGTRPGRRRPARTAAALLGLGLAALVGTPAQADPQATTKQVSYHGYQFTVPRSWRVVDLADDPTACVRFNQHAVYLGHPGTDQNCPSGAIGRTEALVVEPATNALSQQGTVAKPIDHEYDAKAAGVSITATYDTDAALVRRILSSAAILTAAPSSPQASQAPQPLATAALPSSATNYTGKGFDTCAAPSAAAMSSWRTSSPYSAVGIYIGGPNRYCTQPNLTASWVQTQYNAGWRFVPIYAGPIAETLSSPTSQGTTAADDAVSDAAALGLGAGATLYVDIEAYSSAYTTNVLSYASAWTKELHAKGYQAGVYSSSGSGINDLADHYTSSTMPDVIYDALWNGSADTADSVVPSSYWANHQRVHQYSGGRSETWGGTTINIDQDYLDVQVSTATLPHGKVWDRGRPDGGPWDTNATLIDGNDGINAVASAALPDGTIHVETLIGGEIWDRTRSAGGTWGTATKIDAQGAITGIAAAALPNGTLHVQAIVNGQIWDRTRSASGTWSSSTEIDSNGSITDVASVGLPNGDLHVEALVSGSIYDRVRKGDTGNWSLSTAIDVNGNITDLAASATPNGDQHVQALVNGTVYDRVRPEGGTWTNTLIDSGGAVTQISSAGLPNGDLHVEAVVNGQVWDRVHKGTTGNWSTPTEVDANGAIFGTYATATPDGTLHVGTNA